MAKSPEKYFEFLVRLQPEEIVADVTTLHQPTIVAPPAAPESLSEWMARKDYSRGAAARGRSRRAIESRGSI